MEKIHISKDMVEHCLDFANEIITPDNQFNRIDDKREKKNRKNIGWETGRTILPALFK